MATVGQALTAPESGWKRYDDRDSNITFLGANWFIGTGYGYNSTYKQGLSGKDIAVKFNFVGTKLRIIGAHFADKTTSTTIFIDGVSMANINQEGALIYQSLECDISGLVNQEHSVSIINNTRDYLWIDAIDIDETGELKPYSPIVAQTKLTANAGDSQVTLSWDAITGATSYNVKRSTVSGGAYTTIASQVSGNSYVDTSVTNGTVYYYVVTAITTSGESPNSNEVSATPNKSTPTPEPTANVLLRVTIIDSSERDYQLPMTEIDGFINWFNSHTSASTTSYMLNKKVGTQNSKEYLSFDKIISFEVMELK